MLHTIPTNLDWAQIQSGCCRKQNNLQLLMLQETTDTMAYWHGAYIHACFKQRSSHCRQDSPLLLWPSDIAAENARDHRHRWLHAHPHGGRLCYTSGNVCPGVCHHHRAFRRTHALCQGSSHAGTPIVLSSLLTDSNDSHMGMGCKRKLEHASRAKVVLSQLVAMWCVLGCAFYSSGICLIHCNTLGICVLP